MAERKAMINREHPLPIKRQAELLGISRGSVYYHPEPISEADLRLMRRIDELHLEHPFAGARMLRDMLRREGREVGRRHVGTLMRRMGVEALYRKPDTSKKHPAHAVYPYLLRGLAIERANQVWAMDISYIPMARGFVYLCAVLDWHSRRVLAHRVSITMGADFCVEALEVSFLTVIRPPLLTVIRPAGCELRGISKGVKNGRVCRRRQAVACPMRLRGWSWARGTTGRRAPCSTRCGAGDPAWPRPADGWPGRPDPTRRSRGCW
jgi:putative transposase